MAHYAIINSENIVIQVFVGKDETDTTKDWEEYYSDGIDGYVLRTSYNTRGGVYYDPETGEPAENQSKAFRKNYAGIGYIYDSAKDAFIPPKPFNSWILNDESCTWHPPIPMPEGDSRYIWNEDAQSWAPIS